MALLRGGGNFSGEGSLEEIGFWTLLLLLFASFLSTVEWAILLYHTFPSSLFCYNPRAQSKGVKRPWTGRPLKTGVENKPFSPWSWFNQVLCHTHRKQTNVNIVVLKKLLAVLHHLDFDLGRVSCLLICPSQGQPSLEKLKKWEGEDAQAFVMQRFDVVVSQVCGPGPASSLK